MDIRHIIIVQCSLRKKRFGLRQEKASNNNYNKKGIFLTPLNKIDIILLSVLHCRQQPNEHIHLHYINLENRYMELVFVHCNKVLYYIIILTNNGKIISVKYYTPTSYSSK